MEPGTFLALLTAGFHGSPQHHSRGLREAPQASAPAPRTRTGLGSRAQSASKDTIFLSNPSMPGGLGPAKVPEEQQKDNRPSTAGQWGPALKPVCVGLPESSKACGVGVYNECHMRPECRREQLAQEGGAPRWPASLQPVGLCTQTWDGTLLRKVIQATLLPANSEPWQPSRPQPPVKATEKKGPGKEARWAGEKPGGAKQNRRQVAPSCLQTR